MKNTTRASKSSVQVPPRIDFDAMLAKFSAKDRATFERQLLARDAKMIDGLADRWKHLSTMLVTLAPVFTKLSGPDTMQFYIADGKYRKQVFALHALPDGAIAIYAPNVLPDAIKAGVVTAIKDAGSENAFRHNATGEILMIESLDGSTRNPEAFYKDMTGWNRKAISIILPARSVPAQMDAADEICSLAATQFPAPVEAVPAKA